MKITVKKAVFDLEKIVPSFNDLKPFQFLKEMAGTVAIGNQGIEVDGLMKDYEAHIKEEIDKNSPSSYVRLKDEPPYVRPKDEEKVKSNPDKLVDALRKKLQEK